MRGRPEAEAEAGEFFSGFKIFCLAQIFVGPVPGLSERPQTELSESASARVSAGA